MFNKEFLEEMIWIANMAKLYRRNLLTDDRDRALLVGNGIGADWMPEWLRNGINSIAPDLVVVSWIHDIEFEIGGRWYARWAADFRFLLNGVKMAWYRKKFRTAKQAFRLYLCLVAASWSAFNYREVD